MATNKCRLKRHIVPYVVIQTPPVQLYNYLKTLGMKNLIIILCLSFAAITAFIPLSNYKSGLYGNVEPSDAAKKVWALSETDSVSTIPIAGKFSLEVKPGNWKIYIEANAPYKPASIESVLVQDGQYTDAGTVRLSTK